MLIPIIFWFSAAIVKFALLSAVPFSMLMILINDSLDTVTIMLNGVAITFTLYLDDALVQWSLSTIEQAELVDFLEGAVNRYCKKIQHTQSQVAKDATSIGLWRGALAAVSIAVMFRFIREEQDGCIGVYDGVSYIATFYGFVMTWLLELIWLSVSFARSGGKWGTWLSYKSLLETCTHLRFESYRIRRYLPGYVLITLEMILSGYVYQFLTHFLVVLRFYGFGYLEVEDSWEVGGPGFDFPKVVLSNPWAAGISGALT